MKLRLGVMLLLCSSLCLGATRPRWESNLQERYGLQSFNRARGFAPGWMEQQGIVFLMPDQLLVYQVERAAGRPTLGSPDASGGAGSFQLNIKVLSAQDGRLRHSIQLTTSGETSRIVATRGGGFVAQAGSVLYSYSPALVRIASRSLAFGGVSPMETWEMQASPSGDKLALLHNQVFESPELLSDNSIIHDGRAIVDAQILDAASLQEEASFRLSHTLAFWTLAGDFLFSSNPAHSYADGKMGRLDFKGRWLAIRNNLPKEQHFCRLGMTAMDAQRAAFFGCDAFSVFSSAGKALYSRTDAGCVLASAAAAGPYLALQCDRYRVEAISGQSVFVSPTRPERIEVYDVEHQARRLSVPVHSQRVYYAISAPGELAVIDGATLRVFHLPGRGAN